MYTFKLLVCQKHCSSQQQCSFRYNSSTSLAITGLYKNRLQSHEKKTCFMYVLLVLRKAFDTGNHSSLLINLERCGTRGKPKEMSKTFIAGMGNLFAITGRMNSGTSLAGRRK